MSLCAVSLFQGKFKAVHVGSNEYLLHLSAYVNLNNRVHRLKSNPARSSWEEYINMIGDMCEKDIILKQFNRASEYQEFAEGSLQDILERKKLYKELESALLE